MLNYISQTVTRRVISLLSEGRRQNRVCMGDKAVERLYPVSGRAMPIAYCAQSGEAVSLASVIGIQVSLVYFLRYSDQIPCDQNL